MTRADKIIAAAKSYIGQQEIQPNLGFRDKTFEAKMRARGWRPRQPWCCYLTKECCVESYDDNIPYQDIIKTTMNGGAMNTLQNCRASKHFVVNMTPAPGCVVIFLNGKNGPLGHGAIVEMVQGDVILVIAGNTNTDGSRDGYEVAQKTYHLAAPFNPAGLNIAGFIHLAEIPIVTP